MDFVSEKLRNDLQQFLCAINSTRYVSLKAFNPFLPNDVGKSRPKQHIQRTIKVFSNADTKLESYFCLNELRSHEKVIRFDMFTFRMISAPGSKLLTSDLRKNWVKHLLGVTIPDPFSPNENENPWSFETPVTNITFLTPLAPRAVPQTPVMQ